MNDPLPHPEGFVSSGNAVLDDFWLRHGSRFVELVVVGGTEPSGYGVISGGGMYGRHGLDQDEFYKSVRFLAYIDGVLNVLGPIAASWFSGKVKAEIEKKKSEYEKSLSESEQNQPT